MLRFKVPDMTYGACARRVTNAVQGMDPAAKVRTSPPTREVRV